MLHAGRCLRPITVDESFAKMAGPWLDVERIKAHNEVRPYSIEFEITSRCAGSCIFCTAGSAHGGTEHTIPKEKIFEVVEDALELGIKNINWTGGDALLHPDWYEIVQHGLERGLNSYILSAGMLSKKQAQQISGLKDRLLGFLTHIDTIDPAVFNQLYHNPKTLELRLKGYRNLLEAGFPPEKMVFCFTLTRPMLTTIEATLDFLVDELGISSIAFATFKPEADGEGHYDWEPGLSEIRRALEYRTKKLGENFERLSSSGGGIYCRTNIGLMSHGGVAPCTCIRQMEVGNIYKDRFKDLVERHRDTLLFNHEIKGYCGSGECIRADICFGCRADAFHYSGDVAASDPKCFRNPDAPEYIFTKG